MLPADVPPLLLQAVATLVVLSLALFVYWSLQCGLSTLYRKNKLSANTLILLRRIYRWMMFPIVILLALHQFGLLQNVWATLTAILALVAIGFVAVWSVLSNAFCSTILMIARPFSVGDTIGIPSDNLQGKVVDFNLIFTTLRHEESDPIQIPNNTYLFSKANPETRGANHHCLGRASRS